MHRRSMLKMLSAGALAACPFCAASAEAAGKGGAQWSYEGPTGPENWSRLDESFAACGTGRQQSPIDLRDSITADLEEVKTFWRPLRLNVLNVGYTIQVNAEPGSFMVLDGRRFDLLQFHFHHPSEHTVHGEQCPMEVHFVHQASEGDLGVLGAFIVEGAKNPAITQIWRNVAVDGDSRNADQYIEPETLLPDDRSFFRYAGSLTTPPCSEVVNWAVLAQPVTASARQIEVFRKLYPMSARPVQPLNRRFILGTF